MRFNKTTHTYINDEGLTYTNATSFIKYFCKPFDRFKIGKKYAKKHKRPLEEVLAEWDKLGKDAIDKGIALHDMKERELLDKQGILIDDEPHDIHPICWDGDNKFFQDPKLEPKVYPELIVWSDKYQIAGQADYVEITKGGKINITDYKTSKEIKQEGWPKWDGTKQKLAFPLHNLDDCNFYHYALQLNLYAFLIKQHNKNLKIGTLKIQHVAGIFDDSHKEFRIDHIVDYIVPDFQREIKVALEYWKNKNGIIINK